jgi:hypothetical protein
MMQRVFAQVVCGVFVSLGVLAAPSAAQVDWPIPPDNWWADLEDGGYPSATFEVSMGMPLTLTQSIESVEGTQITLSTAMSMMGNTMPGQSQVIDAATLTPESGIAMMQEFGGGPGDSQMTPEEALAAMNAMIERVESTTCQVGGLELECTLYQIEMEGTTSRVWHAPAIPPVFMGGIVRSEAMLAGQSFQTSMTAYSGALLP